MFAYEPFKHVIQSAASSCEATPLPEGKDFPGTLKIYSCIVKQRNKDTKNKNTSVRF